MRLETNRLILRELQFEDWPEARALDDDPEVVRYQSNDIRNEEQTKQYLRKCVEAAAQVPRQVFDFALCLKSDERLLGRTGVGIEKPEHREGQIWFNLRRDHWGRGLVTEALRGVLTFGFEDLKLHRAYGDCDPRNLRSARVMEKVGMRREAYLRQNWWLKGEWCDSYIYALLEHDWKARARK